MRSAALALLAACSAAPVAGHAPAEAGQTSGDGGAAPLGLNDVSILLPLPREVGAPVLAGLGQAGQAGEPAGGAMIERRWFAALVPVGGDIAPRTGGAVGFDDFQIVAVRFDLCDRSALGPCPRDAAGQLRLVLQPLYERGGAMFAHDVALHAFYPVPAGQLGAVVGELRRLAARSPAPVAAPLGVSPRAAAGDAAYVGGLRALVLRYARAERLTRLTVVGQIADSAAFAWMFRGLDRRGDELVPLAIPGIDAAQQTVQLAGGDTVYRAAPIADAPSGFALATNGPQFAAASAEQRAGAVAALAALQDPTRHNTEDTQCIGCHLSTYLLARRAATSRIAAPGARGVHTIARDDPRVVRAFGWAGPAPAISQRVVNDTAAALAEIEARYPAGPR